MTTDVAVPTPPETEMPDVRTIQEGTVLMTLYCLCWGVERTMDADEIAESKHGNREAFAAKKKVLDSDAFRKCRAAVRRTRHRLAALSVASPINVLGIYCLPLGVVNRAVEVVQEGRDAFWAAVDEFLAEYPTKAQEAKVALGSAWDERDYPPAEQIRRRFTWTYSFSSYDVPQALAEVSDSAFRDAQVQATNAWEAAMRETTALLRFETKELLDRAVRQLGMDEKGKPRRFHASLITKLNEFFETFAPRNITKDSELSAVIDQLRSVVEGVDVQAIRTDASFREEVQHQFAAVQKTVDALVVDAPRRRFAEDD